MKSLKMYITERSYINNIIPYDLFENFMKDAIIEMNYDDSKYWHQMKQFISDNYDKRTWRWFYGWCESYLSLKNTSIKDFYDKISKTPVSRYNRVLGAGSNGIVLSFENDKIIKIFYGDTIKKIDKPFIDWCNKNDSKVFPKVYKVGKNWCVMEKLKVLTPKCKKYMDIIDNCKKIKFISDIIKRKEVDTSIFTEDELEVYNWCIKVRDTMELINSRYIEYPGDLVINNIGERDNGDVVFFDI